MFRSETLEAARPARAATVHDAASIAAVHVATWRTAYAGLLPAAILDAQDERARTASWTDIIARSTWPVNVAEHHGEVVGFASALACRDDDLAGAGFAELAALYVLDSMHGCGVGTRLLARCREDATARGHSTMTLWTFEANHRARAFYAREGFVPDGAAKAHERLGVDEIRMRRAIEAGSASRPSPGPADPAGTSRA